MLCIVIWFGGWGMLKFCIWGKCLNHLTACWGSEDPISLEKVVHVSRKVMKKCQEPRERRAYFHSGGQWRLGWACIYIGLYRAWALIERRSQKPNHTFKWSKKHYQIRIKEGNSQVVNGGGVPGDENVGLYNTECVWESFPWQGRRPCKDGFSL